MSDAPGPAPAADGEQPAMSKTQLKKLEKQRRAAEAKEKKRLEREAKEAASGGAKKAKAKDAADFSPEDFRAMRTAYVDACAKDASLPFGAYPHKFNVSHSVHRCNAELVALGMEPGAQLSEHPEKLSVAGRLMLKRSAGAKLVFMTMHGDGESLQLVCEINVMGEERFARVADAYRGDLIGVVGFPGRTRKGENSLFVTELTMLAPCLRVLPDKHKGLGHPEARYRQRYLDLATNRESRDVFVKRARIIRAIRAKFDDLDFIEVETPILSTQAGGATAKPFQTHLNDLHLDMTLRIAPELNLKKLVVGGLERVYEIGKNCRNEGMDMTHNPEFTMCEAYAAYWDYEDLMKFTEDLLAGIVHDLTGGYTVTYHAQGPDSPPLEIDFTPPFRRVPMLPGLEERMGCKLPEAHTLDTPEAVEHLKRLCAEHQVDVPPPMTPARMLDRLVERFIEPEGLLRPLFITHHPETMSPLAKTSRTTPGETERFELFVAAFELANAYTELNMPAVQRERFETQARAKADGDDEAMGVDEGFIEALEYGLPPTAGWGLGIDRLTMILCDKQTIRDVILFPTMKPIDN